MSVKKGSRQTFIVIFLVREINTVGMYTVLGPNGSSRHAQTLAHVRTHLGFFISYDITADESQSQSLPLKEREGGGGGRESDGSKRIPKTFCHSQNICLGCSSDERREAEAAMLLLAPARRSSCLSSSFILSSSSSSSSSLPLLQAF